MVKYSKQQAWHKEAGRDLMAANDEAYNLIAEKLTQLSANAETLKMNVVRLGHVNDGLVR